MKTLLSISLLLSTLTLSAGEVAISSDILWVDEQVEAIKPSRVGVNPAKISALKDPVVFLTKIKEAKKVAKKSNKNSAVPNGVMKNRTASKAKTKRSSNSFRLQAVMNKSVLINKKWYKLGDSVGSYTITEVKPTSATLIFKKKILVITTNTTNPNIKFNN